MKRAKRGPLPPCVECGFVPAGRDRLHLCAVTFADGRRVVGQPAIAEAIREWSRKPAVAAVFATFLRPSERAEEERSA